MLLNLFLKQSKNDFCLCDKINLMKELDFLKVINNTLSDSSFLGDDCALLDEYGLYITQDTLVEDVHFSLDTISPYLLGQKSINVNLSDLAAMCATPLYVTVSLSLPDGISGGFIQEFYKGIDNSCAEYGVKVVGGDLTFAPKVFISICAIGRKNPNVKISRSFAKVGDVVLTTGTHGDSAAGLKLLTENRKEPQYLINKHLKPVAQIRKSQMLLDVAMKTGITEFAMMDTSDGLGDAVYKISKASGVSIEVGELPVSQELKAQYPDEYKNMAMWGGEDFELLCCVPQELYDLLDKTEFYKIGIVTNVPLPQTFCEEFESKSFKHFN